LSSALALAVLAGFPFLPLCVHRIDPTAPCIGRFGPSPGWATMASADFCTGFPTPLDVSSTEVALGTRADLPGYDAPTFTLMSVGYTSRRSVQVSGFDDIGRLTPPCRLVSASCSSDQRFALGFLQISSRPEHPCRSANSSPCRASRGLAPPSECALPGAHRVGDGVTPVALSHHRRCGSASGGSLNTLESSHRIEQRHQTASIKEGLRERSVHVAGATASFTRLRGLSIRLS